MTILLQAGKAAIFILLLSLFQYNVLAQINVPFAICAGNSATFTSNISAGSYLWLFDRTPLNFSLASLPASAPILPGLGVTPAESAVLYENGNWHNFITSAVNNTLIRLDYGSSPLNTPTSTTVGTYGMDNQLRGLDIIKDITAQTWYGFMVNGTQLIRLTFGSSLTNTPTATAINLASQLSTPYQISLQKVGTTWTGFIGNRDGAITRLVFSGGLAQTPTVFNLPINNYSSPAHFAWYQQSGNWYLLIANLTSGNISRMSFGTNIQNNNPTVADLGNFGRINLPGSINVFADCNDQQLLAYVMNENGQMVQLNFNGNITSTPTSALIGTYANGSGGMTTFVFDHTIYGLRNAPLDNTVHRVPLFTLPASASVSYASYVHHTYATPGTHSIRLYTNAGHAISTAAYCQEINVDDCNPTNVTPINTPPDPLSQNYPNPVGQQARIDYYLQAPVQASIIIKDVHGRVVRQYNITQPGKGNIWINTEQFSDGIYFYTLINNGLMLATKKMVVHR